ncbi:MAG: aminotransferase class III-fold pyridoxal phosphate-dependent enzyme [bacterium]|nr:aminotransferase class III-fold pyridoxal phosphate-dependent enzyme [bacterium]
MSNHGHLWLPFTQMAAFSFEERTFVRGEGCELIDARGRRLFDAISSVWTTIHGHGHPHIVEAIARQAAKLDHATALGAANPPAVALAERLGALTGLECAFFSGDGASAVEAALKIALQYWRNVGQPARTRFAHLTHAYHGDTAAAMSVSDIALFKERFAPLLFETLPYEALPETLERHDLAAVIVEPRVQAAAGMLIVPEDAYAPLRVARNRPLVIVDEIATGFGRTGPMFAFTALGLEPDLVCLGKGITGGTLALSATLAREYIYAAFLGEHREGRHLFHGHSYAANPIACAGALASLEVFDREHTLAHVAELDLALQPLMERVREHALVREVRRIGLMCAIELRAQEIDAGAAVSPAWRIADELYRRGQFTRPLGDAIQLVPPPAAARTELESFTYALLDALDAVLGSA